ncbi:MAG: hypothetical protein A3G87_09180 [Omnitrophica bacterium RIFCSPLOWO2_12_FULL_50_11]|nr:MAG: hypothetical protein A3G87_09180 [Omnitrophica bacterium RIFCSPLOWO2_12_FULL_50_11]
MRKKVKDPLVRYDSKVDALYILTRKGAEEEVVEMAPGVNLELNEQGGVVGIEILNASKLFRGVTKSMYRQLQES